MFDLLQMSRRLIRLRSDGERGTQQVVQFLAPCCKRLGFQVQLQAAPGSGHSHEVNLLAHAATRKKTASRVNLCPGGLLWVTHLDTVPPGDRSLWTRTGGNPFRATVSRGRIYGLGSADTKLDFLCKLLAIHKVGLSRISVPFVLAGTFGEERALAGIRLLKQSRLVQPRWALVGEPSRMEPVLAHKGILYMRTVWEGGRVRGGRVLEKTFLGKSAHGSMPHLGVNAIEKAAGWLVREAEKNPQLQLMKIEGGSVHNIVPASCRIEIREGHGACPRIAFLREFFRTLETIQSRLRSRRNAAFDPPQTTLNVGVIRGDEKRIEIEFDFRLIPEADGDGILERLRGISQIIPGARIEVIRSNAPMHTRKDSEVAKHVASALRSVKLPVRWGVKSGNTEGAILSEMGAQTIVIGPGRSVGNIHAPNEYNEMTQLAKAVDFYAAFLRGFC